MLVQRSGELKRIKKSNLLLTLGLVMAVVTMSFTSVLAHTAANPQWQPLCAGSPHYYGEPGPKDPSWYWDHVNYVGSVLIWNDQDTLYVRIIVNAGEGLQETHLAVAENFEDIPQTKKGNPKVGRFPFKHENLNGITNDIYQIPLDDLDIGDKVYIAVHAALCSGETAWADCGGPDAYFPGNNWATYFTYIIQ